LAALTTDAAHRILGRAAYGARPGEAESLARQGLPAWLDQQLALSAEDPAVEARLAAIRLPIRYATAEGRWPALEEDRPLTRLAMSQAENFRFTPRQDRPVASPEVDRGRLELLVATLVRKVEATAQLRERLVEFWLDHFSVNTAAGTQVSVSLIDFDRRIRGQALGNFRALLEATATAPAMLYFRNCPGTPAKRGLRALLSRKNASDGRKPAHRPPR
jgi:uncharacterized protein (DUF1800 family)